jgi:hypothetical protein
MSIALTLLRALGYCLVAILVLPGVLIGAPIFVLIDNLSKRRRHPSEDKPDIGRRRCPTT